MELEAWTKIHRIRLIIYGVTGILYLILIMNNLGGNILTHALGFFYPALESIKAADKGHKEDCQQWLSFWVILSGLTLVEYTDQALLTMLPYYFLFKVLLVCWLMLPQFRGAHRVYINCLKFLHSHTPKSEVHSGDSKGGDGADKKKKSHPESAPAHKEESQAHASSSSSANKRAGWQYTPLSRVVR
ncbi:TB2/DP1, HVA22 family-domain-containing protein [Chytridium lagenaria]|nr:TB2/DP1, HVA22 family-domain-containing protein [Chytridium lagenaria]